MNSSLRLTLLMVLKRVAAVSLFLGIALLAFAGGLLLNMKSGGASTHYAGMTTWFAWRLVGGLALVTLGMNWTLKVMDTTRETDDLQPHRRRNLADAAMWLGNAILLTFLGLTHLISEALGYGGLSIHALAEACVAISFGAALAIALIQASLKPAGAGAFLLLPFLIWIAAPPHAIADGTAPTLVYSIGVATWPVFAVLFWRLLAQRPLSLRRPPTMQEAITIASNASQRPRRGIEPMLGNPRWLLRPPPSVSRSAFFGLFWVLAVALMLWADKSGAWANGFLIGGGIGFGVKGYEQLREGIRPRLSLLPGTRIRRHAGWLMLEESIRRSFPWLGFYVITTVAATWVYPSLRGVPVAVAMVFSLSVGLLILTLLLTFRVRGWLWNNRELQALATTPLIILGVSGAVQWLNVSRVSPSMSPYGDPAHIQQGMLVTAAVVALALVLQWSGSNAWRKVDLHKLMSTSNE
jgi:hypothetical protein